jgi:hypothetical protein
MQEKDAALGRVIAGFVQGAAFQDLTDTLRIGHAAPRVRASQEASALGPRHALHPRGTDRRGESDRPVIALGSLEPVKQVLTRPQRRTSYLRGGPWEVGVAMRPFPMN